MAERRFGILIASSRFLDEPKLETLRYPENDVDAFGKVLDSRDRGAFHELVVFKNCPRSEIFHKLNCVFCSAAKDDLILIYYSGHGKLNSVGRLHLTTLDTHLSALEATAISMGAIRELVDISATQKVVIILDCCFSGAVGDEFLRSTVDDQLLLASKARGTYIMTASTGIQVAKEKEADQHGLFTKHLIEGLSSGDADLDRNGQINMDELYRYVHERVLAESHQEPMRWDLNVRGELNIARSGKTLRTERNQRLRIILSDLYKEERLPDDIFDKARELIGLPLERLGDKLKSYDQLLDQLLDQTLKPLEFIKGWYRLDDHAQRAAAPPPQTSPEPPARSAKLLAAAPPPKKPEPPAEICLLPGETAKAERVVTSPVPKPTWFEILKRPNAIVAAAMLVILLGVVFFYSVQSKQPDWDLKANNIFTILEQTQRAATKAPDMDRVASIQADRDRMVQVFETLVQEVESKGVDTNPWQRRMGAYEARWREVIETKQRELAAQKQQAPKP